jgi:creatinine amidohydrolase
MATAAILPPSTRSCLTFARETGLKIRSATYFELAASDLAPVLEDQKTVHHACEVETSLMLVLAPDTVKRDRLLEAFGGIAGSNAANLWYAVPARFRSFQAFTPSGVNGDARRASREKGEKLVAICTEGIAGTLRNEQIWN